MRKLLVISTIVISLTFPVLASAQKPQNNNHSLTHVVKAGETLSRIASLYKIEMKSIIDLNKITNPHKLQIGQTLLIPKNNTSNAPASGSGQVSTPAPSETQEEKYIVKAGDILSRIAREKGLSIESIVAKNKLSNPHALQIGQVLILPRENQNLTLASRNDERDRNSENKKTENGDTRTPETDKLAEKIIDYAKTFLGCRYSYGSSGPKKFDCSGFTMYVFNHFAIDLPHNSASQGKKGTAVSKNELKPADLVFFKTNGKSISHVGIYMGNGKFIHASTGGRKVEITSLSDTYYAKRYVTARRILK